MRHVITLLFALFFTLKTTAQITFVGGGPNGNIWSDYHNWQPQQVPSAGDVAVIPTGLGVNINGSVTVGSLILDGGINTNGNPNDHLTVISSFSSSGGYISVNVSLLNGCAGLIQSTLYLTGATLSNAGDLTISGNPTLDYATLKNETSGQINLTGGHTMNIYHAPGILDNFGTVKRTPDGGTFTLSEVDFENRANASIVVETGELNTQFLANYGSIAISAGADLRTQQLNIYNGTTLTGNGTLVVESNGLYANNTNSVSIDVAETNMNSQGVKENGPILFTKHLNWTSGTMFAPVVFTSTAVVDVNPGSGDGITNTTTNFGTINVNTYLGFDVGTLENHGQVLLNGPYSMGVYHASAGIFNYGLVKKPVGSVGTFDMAVPLINFASGSVVAAGGDFFVNSNFETHGSLTVESGAIFRAYNTLIYDGATFAGDGTYKVQGNGLFAFNSAPVSFDLAETVLQSNLSSGGPISFSKHVDWQNSSFGTPTTITTTGTLDLSTNGYHTIGSSLIINGLMNVSQSIYMTNLLENHGTIVLSGGASILGYGSLNNDGLFTKIAGGDSEIQPFLTNSGNGLVQGLADILTLDGLSNGATLSAAAGAEIKLAGYNSLNSLEANGSLTGDGAFTAEANLNANSPQTISIQTFNLTGYYGLGGTAELTFLNTLNWQNGLVECPISIAPTAVLNLSAAGGGLYSTLTNNGTTNAAANLLMSATAVFQNNGAFHLTGGDFFGAAYNYASGTFQNAGSFDKTTAGTTAFNLVFSNLAGGSMDVQNGTLELFQFNNSGSVNIASGATLVVKSGSNLAGGTVGGSGTLDIKNAGWYLTNSLTINGLTLVLEGDLTGDSGATLEIGGSMNWLTGNLQVPTNVAASGVLNISGGGVLSALLTNGGVVHCSTSFSTFADILNNGTWNFEGNNSGIFQNGTHQFLNAGTLNGNSIYGSYLYLNVQNDGTIAVGAGQVFFANLFQNNATLTIAAGSTATFYGETHFSASATATGAGSIEASGSVFQLASDLSFSGENFSLNGGNLVGPGHLQIESAMDWNFGNILTNLTITTAATLHIGGSGGGGGGSSKTTKTHAAQAILAGKTLQSATILNNGTTVQNGSFGMDAGVFTNNGLVQMGYASIENDGAGGVFSNNGTWELDGSATIYIAATNNGELHGNSDYLYFDPVLVNNGLVSPGFSPGRLHFYQNYTNGSELDMEVESSAGAGIGHDFVESEQNLMLGGSLVVSETGAALQGNYIIMQCDGSADCRTGTFSTTTLPSGYVLNYTPNQVILTKGTPATIGPANPTLCSGNSVTLTASAGESYLWNTGETDESIVVSPYYGDVTYSVTVTYAGGGGAFGSTTVHIVESPIVYPYPYYQAVCAGETAVFTAYNYGGPVASYLWSNGATTESISVSPSVSTYYNVTTTNAAGCSTVSYDVLADVNGAAMTPTISGVPSSICQNEEPISLPTEQDGIFGTWSGAGVLNEIFDPAGLSGNQTLTFSPYSGQCAMAAEWVLTVLVPQNFYADADGDGFGNAAVTTVACIQPDGFVSNNTDCNDSNSAVHPGATEVCNNLDDDCDGQIDEEVGTVFYRDADGDGYGNAAVTTVACTQPTGYVSNNTDCNDSNAAIHPGATEICNNLDDDCDGQIDEEVGTVFYRDADGDGYGNAGITTVACIQPDGFVSNNTDCNDSNAAVHPGATEICNNIDDDCDGLIDETTLALSLSAGNINCAGGSTTLTATATGGAGSFLFKLDGGAYGVPNTFMVTAGSHSVSVKDAGGCTVSQTISISQPTAISINPIVVTHIPCGGGNVGAVDISVSGGSPNYTYHWSNNKTTQDISNLAAGTFLVTVIDSHSCTATASAVVNPKLKLTTTKANVICNGGASGTATASATNTGTPPYTFLWSNGATTATIANLPVGTYTVTLTDALGCSRTGSVAISQPAAITISAEMMPATCNGSATGAINVSLSNGTAPFTYLWNDGATTMDRTGLMAGSYSLTVTDANGCTRSKSFTVTQPTALAVSFSKENVSCNGGNDGEITATVSGGVKFPTNNLCNGERYCFLWNTGGTSRILTGITAGTYFLTATDANGCSITGSATISQPTALHITGVAVQNLPANKFKLTVSAAGGTTPYVYRRIPGGGYQSSNVFNNVPAGTYKMVVRDANLCTDTMVVTVPNGSARPHSDDRNAQSFEISDDDSTVSMFPNPATDVVNLWFFEPFETGSMRVFDLEGRVVLEQKMDSEREQTVFSVASWPSGVYFLEIRTNDKTLVKRLSVSRQ